MKIRQSTSEGGAWLGFREGERPLVLMKTGRLTAVDSLGAGRLESEKKDLPKSGGIDKVRSRKNTYQSGNGHWKLGTKGGKDG